MSGLRRRLAVGGVAAVMATAAPSWAGGRISGFASGLEQATLRRHDEAGESSTEHVMWIGAFVVIIIAVAAILTQVLKAHTNTIVSHINSAP